MTGKRITRSKVGQVLFGLDYMLDGTDGDEILADGDLETLAAARAVLARLSAAAAAREAK